MKGSTNVRKLSLSDASRVYERDVRHPAAPRDHQAVQRDHEVGDGVEHGRQHLNLRVSSRILDVGLLELGVESAELRGAIQCNQASEQAEPGRQQEPQDQHEIKRAPQQVLGLSFLHNLKQSVRLASRPRVPKENRKSTGEADATARAEERMFPPSPRLEPLAMGL